MQYVHKRVVHRDNKDLPGIFELRGVNVAGNMVLGTRGRESRGDTW
jgi:hypothetical protein